MIASDIDAHLGKKLKMARLLRDMTQHDLGSKLGVTLQQVQKYERGHNRISASKLYVIARALDVGMGFFFDDISQERAMGSELAEGDVPDERDLLKDSDALMVARLFVSIKDPACRKVLVNLLRLMSARHPAEQY